MRQCSPVPGRVASLVLEMVHSYKYNKLDFVTQAWHLPNKGVLLQDLIWTLSLCISPERAHTLAGASRCRKGCPYFGGEHWEKSCLWIRFTNPRQQPGALLPSSSGLTSRNTNSNTTFPWTTKTCFLILKTHERKPHKYRVILASLNAPSFQ